MRALAAADLRRAAQVIETYGWAQGVNSNAAGCRCAMGALAFAVSDGATSSDGKARMANRERFYTATNLLLDVIPGSISGWNDEPGRSATEVIAALRAAADNADRA